MVGSIENRFLSLRSANQLVVFKFRGQRPAANLHQHRVDWFSGRIEQVGWVGRVPILFGHPYTIPCLFFSFFQPLVFLILVSIVTLLLIHLRDEQFYVLSC